MNRDCPNNEACVNGQCQDPCLSADCGSHANCETTKHQPVCLCRSGYQRDPRHGCRKADCTSDSECHKDKQCSAGQCVNPCTVGSPCGRNAECRVNNHQATCVCPSGYYGNPITRCEVDGDDCAGKNPCGPNAVCQDLVGTYQCQCRPGCFGDAKIGGCKCPQLADQCKKKQCGRNALCRKEVRGSATCYCPYEYPKGNPNVECTKKDGKN